MISKLGENLVFLLGVPRSGTTLLSVMLEQHPQVRCPPEPWLMLALESLGRVSPRHPADAPVLYRAHKRFSDPADTVAAARQYALSVYNQVLGAAGKKVLVDKTPRYYLILPYLTEIFPRARYVILWRNPLDIAASIRTSWQVDVAAQLGAGADHLACIDLVVGPRRLLDFSGSGEKNVYSLSYEGLAGQPRKTFGALLRWLGLPVKSPAAFKLAGGEFDRGDIGDKKILATGAPHKMSIGRWSKIFSAPEIATIVQAIGPQVFSAMGYDDALTEALRIAGVAPEPLHSNAYAQRLEVCLQRRGAEYETVETFSDLTIQERRLREALGSAAAAGSTDLCAELRAAADSVVRADELRHEAAVLSARLDEARSFSRDWHAKLSAQQTEIESGRLQLNEARERVAQLVRQLQDAQTHQQVISQQLADQQVQSASLTAQLHQAAEAATTNSAQIQNLLAQLANAQRRITQTGQAPPNRQPWPYAAPDAPPLPATLPEGKAWPRISIVTPSFNQGCYIEETILSVLGQNYPDLEYIIIDGGSTDETMSIVDRYRDRISCVISEKDDGQSSAINKGFARATGELFMWLNSDDMLEPGAPAAMAMAFHQSGADLVAGVCTLHTGGVVASRHLTACVPGPLSISDLLGVEHCWLAGQFFHQPEVMFTRDLWDRAGGYVDEKLRYSMDFDLWLRFAQKGAKLHVIGRPIALFRVHEQQKTFRVEDYRPELLAVRDKHYGGTTIGDADARRNGKENGQTAQRRTHLRVLFFNDVGDVGGAGIAHRRLAASFAIAGHEAIPVAICRELTRCGLSNDDILQAIADRSPDVVFLGNIHASQLDPALIGLIAQRWPTLQVLHDFHSLTGRCAYTGDCTRYLQGCDDACPTADEYPALEASKISVAWQTKQQIMTGEDAPILAAVSTWTEQFAHRRFALAQRKPAILGIRCGLPTELFRPRDKSTCRQILDLPEDRFIVLFSSCRLEDPRKGLDDLFAALRSLKLPDLLAVCIGGGNEQLQSGDFELRCMGYVADTNSLVSLYGAADIFVGPSRVETFGQVFIEAAACGTPSVGYATAGGVADAIADGVSGCLAAVQSPEALAREIRRLHDDPELRRNLGAWGRMWVENEFSLRSTYQRIFAQLNQLGLLRRLGLPPKVSFFKERASDPALRSTSEPASGVMESLPNAPAVTYLDPPTPAPTAADYLVETQKALVELEAKRVEGERTITGLEAERDALRTQNERRIADLEAQMELLQVQSDRQIAELREQSGVRIAELENERESLRVHIQNITQTRLWRMVGTVYPVYQRTLGRMPKAAKRPAAAVGQWLGQRKKQN